MKTAYRVLAVMLAVVMVVSAGSMAVSAAGTVSSFSDVTKVHWGYETIMEMTRMGLFKGMTEPVNGVSEFWPERTMSRAEFVTVSLRAIYPDEAKKIQNEAGQWWTGYYELALKKGILSASDLGHGLLDRAMTRQEMAMVMVRCVEKNGETVDELVSTDHIADYSVIAKEYREYVRKCFSFGLIVGIDEKGTFAPTMSLTRAQAATVLCRLVDQSARVPVGGNSGSDIPGQGSDEKPVQVTWDEFCAMTEEEKQAFMDSFASGEAFEAWLESVGGDVPSVPTYPWENGGKQPKDYTWDEFCALSEDEVEAFIASFGSNAEFEKWAEKVQTTVPDFKYPWENGGKQPKDYTWDEFCALDEEEMTAFMDWFGSEEAFEEWLMKVS